MKKQFSVEVLEPRNSLLTLPLPDEIMKKYKLKHFMAANWGIGKNGMKISFSKTVKIKVGLDRKTLNMLKQIMAEEGWGSIDEVVNNAVLKFGRELGFKGKTDIITFIYPMDYFKKRYWTIGDYEKRKV
ncbi:MAG: hypothetical protein ABID38_02330 [Candidatus Diapherotrites archaeon]